MSIKSIIHRLKLAEYSSVRRNSQDTQDIQWLTNEFCKMKHALEQIVEDRPFIPDNEDNLSRVKRIAQETLDNIGKR